jgi:hypothetical protein
MSSPPSLHRSESLESSYTDIDGPFPLGAACLKIVHHTYVSRERPRLWVWYIVGTFYDDENNALWTTEIVLGHKISTDYLSDTENLDGGLSSTLDLLSGEWHTFLPLGS